MSTKMILKSLRRLIILECYGIFPASHEFRQATKDYPLMEAKQRLKLARIGLYVSAASVYVGLMFTLAGASGWWIGCFMEPEPCSYPAWADPLFSTGMALLVGGVEEVELSEELDATNGEAVVEGEVDAPDVVPVPFAPV